MTIDRRMGAVAGNDERVVGKGRQLLEGIRHLRHAAAREVGASYRACEKRIAAQEKPVGREMVADCAWRMSRSVDDFAYFQLFDIADVGGHSDGGVLARHLVEGVAEHHGILAMHVDRKAGKQFLEFGDARNVVEVGVGEKHGFRFETFFLEKGRDARAFLARIDDPCPAVF